MFQQRFGKTALAQSRFKLPLQVLAPSELADGTAYLMLLNPTGGLVGGDFLFSEIMLEADTRVCLTTPSATRVYRTRDQAAVQETRIHVGEGASLEYLPDHVIPQRDSKFDQSLRVEMSRGSRAIFWDALAAGRVAHGERWNFHEVDSRMDISLCGQTVFLNRTWIRPACLDPKRLGLPRGSTTWRRFWLSRMDSNEMERNGCGHGCGTEGTACRLRRGQCVGERWMRRQIVGAVGLQPDAGSECALRPRAPDGV